MAQHFLQSARARTLSLGSISRMSDEEAFNTFRRLRWPETDGEAVCPRCGGTEPYPFEVKGRKLWKCRDCVHQFSVTSGTVFANRKLPLRTYLEAIALFVINAKGENAIQMSHRLDVAYKTAWVLCHKIREVMADELRDVQVGGDDRSVEVDGAYIGGSIRPANVAADRKDGRKFPFRDPSKQQVIMAVRERRGRVVPFVALTESNDNLPRIVKLIAPGSVVHADQHAAYDRLIDYFPKVRRINHKEAYSLAGACTNWAESFFSRIRRSVRGIHHRMAGDYLPFYVGELAWRENHRRDDNLTRFEMVGKAALAHPVSRYWAGYWQRHHSTVT